ncbi:MAG TPA: phosphoenolpyruvate carboxykinase [Thermomicrobiales bacterium]|nr:phosphoenolpyruvate carboxykinase [Thermomicrobiales bacterium]
MVETTQRGASRHGLDHHGIRTSRQARWNLTAPALYEESIRRHEAEIAGFGPLSVSTGEYTGRSPQDKFIVQEPTSQEHVWWGPVNQPFDPDRFDSLHQRVADYLSERELFVQDLHVGADATYRMPLRVVGERAWHSLFARTMFIRPPREELAEHVPAFTVLHAPSMHADPERDGTRTRTFIVVNMAKRLILVGGTEYGGEIKKSIFSVMNYRLPLQNVMSMHCSANEGPDGDVALFFGLSGTGKTTLSSDPSRTLIGDDEHGWSDDGIFNFEGGCYAKVINLSAAAEPEIFAATRTFGTVLENCVLDPVTREIAYNDASLTENTRAAYPLDIISNASRTGVAGHPRNVMFLTADAFGVLPPISRLTPEQASYYFLLGYTAKVAGTERGLTEPEATFSTCFGAPFMTLSPNVYGRLLGQKIRAHGPDVWLVNTGWTGGAYGVGHRMSIKHTRAMIDAALNGALDDVPLEEDSIFGVQIPTSVPDVPSDVLVPRNAWTDKEAYERAATRLARSFRENFSVYATEVDEAIREAGPRDV